MRNGRDVETTSIHVNLSENAKVELWFPPHEFEVGCGLGHDNFREGDLAHKIVKYLLKS